MSLSGEREEGGPASKTSLSGEHESQAKAKSSLKQDRPDSPVPSCVSMKSDWSMEIPNNFSKGVLTTEPGVQQERPDSPVPSCVSMKSDRSMGLPLNFSKGVLTSEPGVQQERPDSPVPSCVSMKSDWSMPPPLNFSKGVLTSEPGEHQERPEVPSGQSVQCHQTDLASIFTLLEENMITFVKKELKRFQEILSLDYPECLESRREEKEQRSSAREGALKITLHLLRNMKQQELADTLENRTRAVVCQRQIKTNLKKKFECVFEGIAREGNSTLLNQIYTDVYMTEGGSREVNTQHEVRQIEAASRKPVRPETPIRVNDIFKGPPGRDKPIRTVLTNGVAGIGKTVCTQKFTLNWADGKANQNIQFTLPLSFRELNLLKGMKCSFMELLYKFFVEMKEFRVTNLNKYKVVFVFDGLDECRLPLDFQNNEIWTDVTESTSVDVLLTNLIKGNLLPSAQLWITTRPAAANQIPPECVCLVTEVRGFTDSQKDKYFRKRFSGKENMASRVISHVKTSRSLHIMCHIPVFCCITATVLEHILTTDQNGELPKTLTEMYIHFLVFQCIQGNVKYHGRAEADSYWNTESRKIILSLGKLAFQQLEKGNLIFYESDLTECGIDARAASVCSGMFTQIFREERGLYQSQNKVFCFVHLSIQEFMAALYVFLSFFNRHENVLPQTTSNKIKKVFMAVSAHSFYQIAVSKALQSENGHWDLFLRFLLGLSLETNHRLLQGLLTQTESTSKINEETVMYIKKFLENKDFSPERSINLIHCLNELGDTSLVKEVQGFLTRGGFQLEDLSASQSSALVFVLVTSEEELDVFELKKYSRSEAGLLKLLPVIEAKAPRRLLLSGCHLTEEGCASLASALRSNPSHLRELDLSNNDLQDSGVKLLSDELSRTTCKLETLRLSGCMVTKAGFASLASALSSNPSHLRELDLSYNYPGDSGVKLLTAFLDDTQCRLKTLRVDHGGEFRIKPGFTKYACDLTLDPNTAHRNLSLSEENRKVTRREKQPYPDHPERFDYWTQVLCREGLTGSRWYWEVERRGWVLIGVTYRGINRRGGGDDGYLGYNNKSWSLYCDDKSYSAWHNKKETVSPVDPSGSTRVGVYLDCPGGTLSFYRVSSDTLTLIHTFHSTFTQPLYPGFMIWWEGSSVSLYHR
ncbi:NLR family CARD domain-containing protein 3-like isoform 3-T3 [Aplochiton taeniatus]